MAFRGVWIVFLVLVAVWLTRWLHRRLKRPERTYG
jgi:hypothetical protein